MRKRIMCINTGEIYDSQAAASQAAGVDPSTMSKHISGKIKTVKNRIYIEIDPALIWAPDDLKEIRRSELNRAYGICAEEISNE